jgi:trans-2,3-dihydro-3-hydroxyanthranilate isomerase
MTWVAGTVLVFHALIALFIVAGLPQVSGLAELSLCVAQGVDMGRPSILFAKVGTPGGRARVRVGGKCVSVMEGSFQLAGDD